MKREKATDKTVVPPKTAVPIVPNIKIREINTNTIRCPPSILANRQINQCNRFCKHPEYLDNGTKEPDISSTSQPPAKTNPFQICFVPKRFTAKNVQTANTRVIEIFPDKLAPPGNITIIPKILIQSIKKKSVSR